MSQHDSHSTEAGQDDDKIIETGELSESNYTFKEFMKLLNSGLKILEPLPDINRGSSYSITLVGNEQWKSGKQLPYIVQVENNEETKNFLNSLNSLNENYILKTRTKGFILFDIVNYSKLELKFQIGILARVSSILNDNNGFHPEKIIPTGDGAYLVFVEDYTPRLVENAIKILRSIKDYNSKAQESERIYLRIAIHTGEVDYFVDLANGWNLAGPGMNDTARILSAIPSDRRNVIFVSEAVAFETQNSHKLLGPTISFKDKHGCEHLYCEYLFGP